MDLFITVAESSSEKGRFVPVTEGQLDTLETLVARCRKKFYALESLPFQVDERLQLTIRGIDSRVIKLKIRIAEL